MPSTQRIVSRRTPAASPGAAGRFGFGIERAGTDARMALVLLILLLILILGGVGLAVAKLLLWIALILLAIWIIGFFVRGAEGARWYRW